MLVLESSEDTPLHLAEGREGWVGEQSADCTRHDWEAGGATCVQETTVSWMDGGSRLSAGLLTSSLTPFQAIVNPAATVTLKKTQVSSFPSSVCDVSRLGCFIQKLSIHSLRNPPSLSRLVWLLSAKLWTPRRGPGEVSGKLGQENVIVPQVKRGF